MSIARGKLASDTNHASTAASLMHRGLLSLRILLGVKLGCEGLLSLRNLLALGVQVAGLCILDPIAPGMLETDSAMKARDGAMKARDGAMNARDGAMKARDGVRHATKR